MNRLVPFLTCALALAGCPAPADEGDGGLAAWSHGCSDGTNVGVGSAELAGELCAEYRPDTLTYFCTDDGALYYDDPTDISSYTDGCYYCYAADYQPVFCENWNVAECGASPPNEANCP